MILPPALIKGRGIPVAGIIPVLVPIFINTSSNILNAIPKESIEKKYIFRIFHRA